MKSKNKTSFQISSDVLKNSKNVLIIDSESENDVKLLNSLLTELLIQEMEVTLILEAKKLGLIHQSNSIKFVTYNPTDKTYLNLPKDNIIDEICDKDYDILIDLNKSENVFSFFIIKKINSKYKIGFAKINADKYYNFQLDPITNSENSEKFLLNCLKMFSKNNP